MISVSSTYNTIVSGTHHFEVKLVVGEGSGAITLNQSAIYSIQIDGSLFASDTLSFGGCVSRMIEAKLRTPSSSIPRMAMLRPYVRATNDTQTSEWIQKGVFYIDTRSYDQQSGVLTLTGYDAMLKAETIYIDGNNIGLWPQTMRTVASDIASILGLSFDSRSYTVSNSYQVQLPAGYTMREVLSYIAAAHAGNWTITDTGKLRLISAASSVDLADLGFGTKQYTTDDTFAPISKYRIILEGNEVSESGTDSGRTVEVVCPWGNVTIASDCLSRCSGFSYHPFEANGTVLPPIIELGDKIKINNVTHVLVSSSQSLDSLCGADISAPAENEVDHEYPYTPSGDRELKRVEGQVASLKITVDSIDLTGYVTFTEISNPQSQTFIDGANIITGTISADAIKVSTVWNAAGDKVAIYSSGSTSLYMGGVIGQSGWNFSNVYLLADSAVTIGHYTDYSSAGIVFDFGTLSLRPSSSVPADSWDLGNSSYPFGAMRSRQFTLFTNTNTQIWDIAPINLGMFVGASITGNYTIFSASNGSGNSLVIDSNALSVFPYTNNTWILGSSSSYFSDAYINYVHATGIYIGTALAINAFQATFGSLTANGNLVVYGAMGVSGDVSITGGMTVSGPKSRIVSTDNYSDRLLYCLEAPEALFEDVGEAETDGNGTAYIFFDPIFAETIYAYGYQVFLQPYGSGSVYVSDRNDLFFEVTGTPNMPFGWRVIAKQSDYTDKRLDEPEEPEQPEAENETEEVRETIHE